MKIDIFPHIIPSRYKEALLDKQPKTFQKTIWYKYLGIMPALTDLNSRFRLLDRYDGLVQVLTLAGPPVEDLFQVKDSIEMARLANDEMAELVAKYPDRFLAFVACLPVSDVDAALIELDRAVNDLGCKGIELCTSIHGKPLDAVEFTPFYTKMAGYDLPIWIHPKRERLGGDYSTEKESKYLINSLFGREYETAAAMTRLIFSGVLERYPNIKFVTHHFGGMVSYLEKRIEGLYALHEKVLGEKFGENLGRPPIEYYRRFYCDTAYGSTQGLMCVYSFFGANRVLFGTDMPYDSEAGNRKVRETIRSIEKMAIPEPDKEKIFEENARQLLKIGKKG